MEQSIIDIKTTIRGPVPRIPFADIARTILGDTYELSLVICGDTLARRMNIEYRKKSYAPNVLSFPLSKNEGEIFLNIRKSEREAKFYNIPTKERLAYLYVHGCFHLKGLDHGKRMEKEEARIMKSFK
ncbi:MAG TPA: rRNA maturation RNase YbeY [Candidatus Paceibacterota bacterium]|nr:rRNA maturation RNase YbeY [Candidatus Paceibacterota bacterium]